MLKIFRINDSKGDIGCYLLYRVWNIRWKFFHLIKIYVAYSTFSDSGVNRL
jgi:hypothetical protein